jgi:hypothetical protein
MSRAIAMLILMSFVGGSPVGQDAKADATLKLTQGNVAAGVDFSRGKAAGGVYNLNKLEEFSGNYAAAGAGATVGGRAGVTAMKNQNGVVIE